MWKTGFRTKLPDYFYNIADPIRWHDVFAENTYGVEDEDRKILSIEEMYVKYKRNSDYKVWMRRHKLRPSIFKWQRVRIIKDSYVHTGDEGRFVSNTDWWPRFHGAIFTVWVQPQTLKDGKHFTQWYVLCPEDSELVARYEYSLKHPALPPRDLTKEPFCSTDPRINMAYVVPAKCCHHLKNETFAGKTEYLEHL